MRKRNENERIRAVTGRPRVPSDLLTAGAMMIATIPIFFWLLGREGILGEAGGNLAVLGTLAVALLTIGWLDLARPIRDRNIFAENHT